MKQIGIQRIFWDALELAISTQAKRLVRDIADSVAQDPAPLLAEIQKDKVGVYLFEDSGLDDLDVFDMRCKHTMEICGRPGWRTTCMEPVLWSANPCGRTGACLTHSLNPEPRDPSWKEFMQYNHKDEIYYINLEDGGVYTIEGDLCGRYSAKKKQVVLFTTE